MDQAGQELSRIVAFVNRRPWLVEGPSDCCCQKTYAGNADGEKTPFSCNYFMDRLGVTDMGDSSLHRICAWHATPEQLQAFLDHMQAHHEQNTSDNLVPKEQQASFPSDMSHGYDSMPSPPSLDQTNNRGVTALHVAVYRNSYHAHSIVQQLLRQQPSLASTPMSCGSYPLHILCGHNVTIRKEIMMALLEADPSVVWKEDQNGDTPLSLLWKNVLRFRWAQQDQIALEEEEEEDESMVDNDDFPRRRRRRRPSWMTVISPDQYVDYSLLLIRAALGKHNLQLGDICRMPRCPPLLIRLVLQHYNKLTCNMAMTPDCCATDDQGMTPLHHAAHVDPVTVTFVPPVVQAKMWSVVDHLLDWFPTMACMKDQKGRIPLHYALEKDYASSTGSNFRDAGTLYRFVRANPDSLGTQDPVSGLYPFALLAASSATPATQHCDEDDNVCDPMEIEESMQMKLEHLDAIYSVLRQFPEASIYHG